MSSGESLTQRWLRQNVRPYSQKDRVYVDVDAALTRFSALRPKSDVYIYDDGRSQLLLCVHGLLPISFRSASYNIPIAIWLTREYPRNPPIAYVIPTSDMLVKAGKFIDVSGRCNIEYLQQWARKNETCNLSALLEAMQEQFSREPPVYAKPPDGTSVPPTSQPTDSRDYRSKPPPPLPKSSIPSVTTSPPVSSPPMSSPLMSSPPATSSPVAISDRPTIPPKPMLPVYLPPVDVRPPTPQSRDQHPKALEPPPPPRPPPRTTTNIGLPEYRSSYVELPGILSHPRNRSAVVGHHTVSRFAPADVYDASHWQGSVTPVGASFSRAGSSGSATSPSYPPQVSMDTPQHEVVISEPPSVYPNLLDEDSADTPPSIPPLNVSIQPPPRPQNPETLHLHTEVYDKLMSELGSLSEALATDANRLRAHQADLLHGEPAIRDEMARLEAVRVVCSNVAGRVKGMVNQAESNIAELRRKGDPEIDELVCSTTIVHNQLVTLVAEDNAVEDTIYHLHRALNAGRIDLERFLRSTRLLAEEQFMKRALIEKIQAGMPMGWSMGSEWS